VVARLADLGYSQRLVVRDSRCAPDLLGAEITEAFYHEPQAMQSALTGLRTFFMVSGGEA